MPLTPYICEQKEIKLRQAIALQPGSLLFTWGEPGCEARQANSCKLHSYHH